MNEIMFSRNSDEWATPQYIFDELNAEFHFDLDPCSDSNNHKTNEYYTTEENGLEKDWGGRCVFCNPPYSKIQEWVRKCYFESIKPGTLVVMLIPSRTDTKYFHDYILNRSEIRFIRGRIHFNDSKNCAPFPSMIVIFRAAER